MLKVQNATLKRDERVIFENYSFEIQNGDIVAVLGPNGRGKTTLLKAILNLLPLNNGSITSKAQIAYVPQNTQLIFDFTVVDVILMGRAKHLKLFSNPSKKDYDLVYEVLELLEIKRFVNRNFGELSGGERQLILIARAIVSQCDFLILDEPASALDFSNQKKVLNQLKTLNRTKNMTILYTTHYPGHAFYLSNKVLLMFEKSFLFDKTKNLMTNEILSNLYNIDIKKVAIKQDGRDIESVIPIF
jgi:iron complex transport system ATP-binding protein